MSRAFSYIDRFETSNAAANSKIGEVSKRSGIGVEALRFYEKNGLLERPNRTHSGYRTYSDDVLDRLAFIKQAQLLGFSLFEIKQLINQKRKGESPCLEAREIIRRRLDELNEKIAQLVKHRDEVSEALVEWDDKGRADGHVCGLIEESNIRTGANNKKIDHIARAPMNKTKRPQRSLRCGQKV
ncbi:MAG: heavy metal-responsive transcriptional regulator [Pyrinomonadaceae bacterium]|nr:heavy metal-responsive transcriptional regulator [Pyrinomonadaceae bacterium]